MRELVLLDTSALLALRDDEPGAQRVAALLVDSAKRPASSCLGCFMSRMEVLYRVWKDEGEYCGRLAHEQVLALPIRWVEASDALLMRAAELKAGFSLSVADAWIAAAADLEGARLLHKDPEFRAIPQLAQEWLN
jgi:predicted nucleic acid-binding protein